MAEAYRGLTIRLGADASDLVKSLRYTSSAISDTQRQLRSLQKAAKIDPDGMRALGLQVDVAADKALGLTKKVRTLNEVIKKAEASDEFRQIGGDLEYASTKAADAKARYAQLCEEIKRLKNEYAKLAGYDDLDNLDPFKGVEGVRDTIAVMERLASENEQAAQSFDEVSAKYKELANLHGIAQKEKELAEFAVEVRNAKVDMAAASAEANQFYRELAKLSLNPKVANTEEFIELSGRIKRCTQAVDELKAETRELDKALDIDPSNMDAARLKMAAMTEQVNLNIQKMKDLRLQIAKLEDAGADKVAAEFVDLRTEIVRTEDQAAKLAAEFLDAKAALDKLEKSSDGKTEAELRQAREEASRLEAELAQCKERLDQLGSAQLYGKLKSDLSGVSSQTYRLVQDMTQAEGTTRAFSGAMQQLGWSAYSTLTPAISIFAHQAITSAEEVDASYRNMRKTVQGTEEQFEALKQAAIDYSRTHFTSADQLLEIEALGGQLGVAVEDLEEFATVVSNLEIATDLDAETAATQLGQLAGITGMAADEFDSYGDALVRLGNNNATMESKISDVMLRISSMGTIVGMSVPELLAWSTAVAATGQGAESAGTAISNTMSDIETAVGAGGEKLQAFADVARMSADDFARAWEEDPSSAMKAFIDGLNAIEEAGGSADGTLGQLGITGVRQKQALLGLMQTVEGLNSNLQMSEDAWNGVSDQWGAAGDAAREADRKAEGFSGSIQLLRNNAQAFATELGESLAPAIDMAADAIAGLTQWYSDLPDLSKQAINGLLLFGAALGPVTVGANAFHNAFSQIKGLISGSRSAWRLTQRDVALVTETISQMGGIANGTAGDAKKLSGEVKKAGTAARLASAGFGILKGAVGILGTGLVIAGIGTLIDYLGKLKERSENLAGATDGLRAAVDLVDDSVINANTAFSTMSTEPARRQVGQLRTEIDELLKSQAELADEINEQWTEINTSTESANKYLDALDRLTGKVDENGRKVALSAEEQAELRIAVENVNQILGTQIEVVDAVNGVISTSVDDIRDQAEAWRYNAEQAAYAAQMQELVSKRVAAQSAFDAAEAEYEKMKALFDAAEADPTTSGWNNPYLQMFAEAEQNYLDAKKAIEAATDAENTFFDSYVNHMQEAARMDMSDALEGLSDEVKTVFADYGTDIEQLATTLSDMGADTTRLKELTVDEWAQIASAYKGNSSDIEGVLENLGVAFDQTAADTLRAAQEISDALVSMEGNCSQKLTDLGIDVYDFSLKLAEAEVSTEELNRIGSDNIASMASAVNGNFESMIWMIKHYNDEDVIDKDGNITVNDTQLVDAQGRVWTWNGTEFLDKNGVAAVDDIELIDAQGNVWLWNGTELEWKRAIARVDGNAADGTAKTAVDDTSKSISYLHDKEAYVNIYGNYGDAASRIWDAVTAISNLASKSVQVAISAVVGSISGSIAGAGRAAGGIRPHAEGGILTRYHAAGAIATRAVPLDIVGEDGAEAIVPLTNKRYATPFARTIAEEFGASRDFERLYAETLYARGVAESMAREMRRAMTGVQMQAQPGTHIDEVNINQRVVTPQEDIYVAAPAMARSAAREIRKLGR